MSKEPLPVQKKTTLLDLALRKARRQKIPVLTAYDTPGAQAAEAAGIDVLLVGDSVGMVVLGYPTTLPVTMEQMVHHAAAVARGASRALLIGDMPFLSYQVSPEEAVRNAGRLVKEGGMEAVKLEGGREVLQAVSAILAAGIPVMGHVGLTPQSIHKLGGWRVQGKDRRSALAILDDALALEEAGCFAVVLESVPARLAALVTERLTIPTIGIGAGAGCDGQVLVSHDLLGLFTGRTPKFVKRYANLFDEMTRAFRDYGEEVKQGAFPATEQTYEMPDPEWDAVCSALEAREGALPGPVLVSRGGRGRCGS